MGAYYAHFHAYLNTVVIISEKHVEFIFTPLVQVSSQSALFLTGAGQFPVATWVVESQSMQDPSGSPLLPISSLLSRCFFIIPDIYENRILNYPLTHFGDTLLSSSLKHGV